MKTEFDWVGWYGELFYWDEFNYNDGNSYHEYKFGPILIKIYTSENQNE